ncbi:hypothetical protein A3715_00040 [Oleiphilus sp. HI0009]|nr:hypothetical protein A3715_00040 [Oleiphilus sp. HI0009]
MPTLINTDDFHKAHQLTLLFNEFEDRLYRAKQSLDQLTLVKANVFRLPRITSEEETLEQESITVEPELHTATAYDLAKRSYSNTSVQPPYSGRVVFRLPGFIQLTGPPELQEKARLDIVSVNAIKDEIRAFISSIPTRDLRFDIVHSALPSVVTLQLTRKILLINEPLLSVTYSWGVKSSIKTLSVNEAIDLIERSRFHTRDVDSALTWSQMCDKNISLLNTLPKNEVLRQRRSLRVQPMQNLRFTEKVPKIINKNTSSEEVVMVHKKKRVDASLPIIVLGDNLPVSSTQLKNFDAQVQKNRGKRADRLTQDSPFIEHFNLFRENV